MTTDDEDLRIPEEVKQTQNQDGQEHINNFLETIMNLEAYDQKIKEVSLDQIQFNEEPQN